MSYPEVEDAMTKIEDLIEQEFQRAAGDTFYMGRVLSQIRGVVVDLFVNTWDRAEEQRYKP